MVLSKFPGGGSEKINNATEAEVIAADQIQIGDTVYTVNDGTQVWDAEADANFHRRITGYDLSPDGKTLVVVGWFAGYAKLYSVDGQTITYECDIYADAGTTALSSNVSTAKFSKDGSLLVLGGEFAGRAKVYAVEGQTVTFLSNIYADAGTTALSSNVLVADFSPDGSLLFLGGHFSGKAKVYSVEGQTITFLSNLYADAGTTELSNSVDAADFSPDGSLLVLGGVFSGKAKVYSVAGQTITFLSNIYANAGTSLLSNNVIAADFSPDGSLLVLGGNFSGYAKVYSVEGQTVTFLSNLYADAGTKALSIVLSAKFSPDGSLLVLGGSGSFYAKVYSVAGQSVTFACDISQDGGETSYPDGSSGWQRAYNFVCCILFCPSSDTLLLGGYVQIDGDLGHLIIGFAHVYAVAAGGVIYRGNLYAAKTKTLSGMVNVARFLSHTMGGDYLLLGGNFDGYAKLYFVDGKNITFMTNIYADDGTTELDGAVTTAEFSSVGNFFVLGGDFTGGAKLYNLQTDMKPISVVYNGDLYTDARGTPFGRVFASAFSKDGSTLVLYGIVLNGSGYGFVYAVDFEAFTYAYVGVVDDFMADYAVFSPLGNLLVCGISLDATRLYAVSGQTITYLEDVPRPNTIGEPFYTSCAVFRDDGHALFFGSDMQSGAYRFDVLDQTVTFAYRFSYDRVYSISTNANYEIMLGVDNGVKLYLLLGDSPELVGELSGGVYDARALAVQWADQYRDKKCFVMGGYGKVFVQAGRFTYGTANLFSGEMAKVAASGVVPAIDTKVGFSKSAIAAGDVGKVKLIGSVKT